ncbi:MAG: type IV secretion system DNA-binding domain-containing protein [Rivularia sp. (in: cyanobacteria)]
MDRNNRDIVGPLVAAILHMIVTRNVSRTVPRSDPLIVALDELPTLYLPALVNWLNENREDGMVGILGYQNIAQLEKVYGKELTRAILGGTATKFIFNPQDPESAKLFSDYLGEMEIQFNSKSRSTGKGGGSHSKDRTSSEKAFIRTSPVCQDGYWKGSNYQPSLHSWYGSLCSAVAKNKGSIIRYSTDELVGGEMGICTRKTDSK